MPPVPKKVRKTHTNATPHSDPSIIGSPPAENGASTSNASKPEQSPEMQTLFNRIIETNTMKMTDAMRTITCGMLHEFWNATKPTEQVQQLQNRLQKVESDNEALRQELTLVKNDFSAKLTKIQGDMCKNFDMNITLSAAIMKMIAIPVDMKASMTKWAFCCFLSNFLGIHTIYSFLLLCSHPDLDKKIVRSPAKHAEWQTMISKVTTQYAATKKLIEDAKIRSNVLQTESKMVGVDVPLKNSNKQNQETVRQTNGIETKENSENTDTFDHRKRCPMCQTPNGRCYCSNKCDERYWKKNRR